MVFFLFSDAKLQHFSDITKIYSNYFALFGNFIKKHSNPAPRGAGLQKNL